MGIAMQKYTRTQMISAWLFCVIVTSCSLYVGVKNLSQGVVQFYEEKMARTWPKTEATIVSMKIEVISGKYTRWMPIYTYRYTINGKQYTNNRQSIGKSIIYENSKDAQLNVAKHPTGSTIPIHYNPESPENSTISISFDTGFTNIMQALMGLLMSVVFGCVLFYLLRPNKKISTLPEQ